MRNLCLISIVLAKSFNLIPMLKKSTEFFQSVQIFPTVFVRIFEKVIWEHWLSLARAAANFSINGTLHRSTLQNDALHRGTLQNSTLHLCKRCTLQVPVRHAPIFHLNLLTLCSVVQSSKFDACSEHGYLTMSASASRRTLIFHFIRPSSVKT